MQRHTSSLACRLALFAAGLTLLAPRVSRAEALTDYTVQAIVRLGEKVGSNTLGGGLGIGQLNDNGQLVFNTSLNGVGSIVRYSAADGTFLPIAQAGQTAPDGQIWPKDGGFYGPVGMNQAGSVAVVPGTSTGIPLGTYRWDARSQTITPVALTGMPAVDGLVFETGDVGAGGAMINNRDEIAFVGTVTGANNQKSAGFFLSDKGGKIRKVVLPGDPLPGQGGKVATAFANIAYLNDTGQVYFSPLSTKDPHSLYAYLWDNGTVSVIAEAGTELPGFGRAIGAFTMATNNKKSSAVIGAVVTPDGPRGIFLWDNGRFTPILLPGQTLPGGGIYRGVGPQPYDAGFASEAGEYPFVLQIEEGGVTKTAAYRIGPDGKLSLIAKSGMTTSLGTLTSIGTQNSGGIAINNKGQVALTAQIDNGPDPTLLLLTPKTP